MRNTSHLFIVYIHTRIFVYINTHWHWNTQASPDLKCWIRILSPSRCRLICSLHTLATSTLFRDTEAMIAHWIRYTRVCLRVCVCMRVGWRVCVWVCVSVELDSYWVDRMIHGACYLCAQIRMQYIYTHVHVFIPTCNHIYVPTHLHIYICYS